MRAKKVKADIVAREERRKRVAELLCRGDMNETEISKLLGYDLSTISKDVKFLKSQAQTYVWDLARSDLAYFYVSTIQDLDKARLSAWDVHDKCTDAQRRDKLAALKVIIACDSERFKLLSEGPSVMAAKSLDEKVRQIQQDIGNRNNNNNNNNNNGTSETTNNNNKRIVV